jgi:protein-S-isoprenylcysteine O-methyltransferase Ste14
MLKTIKADWYFIIPATIVWLAALVVIGWDFIVLQGADFRFGVMALIGCCAMLAGLGLRAAARRGLRKQFSYALRTLEDHRLVTQGIYRSIRHPAYLGDMLFHFGLAWLFSSLYGFLVMLLLVPCFIYRIRIEEGMLVEKFGDEYRHYQWNSKKLIPRLY